MKIIVTPDDIVKLGCWDTYCTYILKDVDPEQILLDNQEFEMKETDALVIGFLKNIRTPHLIHRCNKYMEDILRNKSTSHKGSVFIQKKTVLSSIDKFLNKYPVYWNPGPDYKEGLGLLSIYLEVLKSGVEKLQITEITGQFGVYEYVNSNQVNKLLDYNFN